MSAAASSAEADASSVPAGPAPDRLVFFFSGFDPKGAGYYHRLYREGAASRSRFGDLVLDVGPRRRAGDLASACDIEATEITSAAEGREGAAAVTTTRTRLHFMRWDDIVRRHWHRGALQLLRDYWNVYGVGLTRGDFARIWRKSRAAWGMAVFPLGVALGVLGLGTPALWVLLHHLAAVPAGMAGVLALAGAVAEWRLLVRWIDCEWLLRLYAFTRAQAEDELPALDARMDAMAAWIAETVATRLGDRHAPPLQEVMLVGYSTGSTVASAVLARALAALAPMCRRDAGQATRDAAGDAEDTGDDRGRPALSMLTLGHCVPVAADWAGAARVREELAALGACERLTWHDWSSPADWAAFWRTPPWPEGSRLNGLQRSPRFHLQLSPATYAGLKRDRRLMHLQYLRAPERAVERSGYDWFRMTAGRGTLAGRGAAAVVASRFAGAAIAHATAPVPR